MTGGPGDPAVSVPLIAEKLGVFPLITEWGKEALPRLTVAGGVIGVILTKSTLPQVVRTSDGRMPKPSWATWTKMVTLITPKAAALKTAQYSAMREMKLALDPITGESASKMLSFGVIGTLFQSVIYNTLISDMYKIHTGVAKERITAGSFLRGIAPGVVWCFGREGLSMGGGLVLQPFVKRELTKRLDEQGVELPEFPLRFLSGFLSGSVTAFGTQWLHNTTLMAGRMAAMKETKEAPHYTMGSLRAAYGELGVRIFYMNYPHRMALIAGAVALLSMVDIFHRPDLRLLGSGH
mmetsp:Transcript_24536/g.54616  ORF Transcript_24536/g.54616 Transcript_24536/m.54616 type:complete len:294 (+) Transcript_24536:44-925(+)